VEFESTESVGTNTSSVRRALDDVHLVYRVHPDATSPENSGVNGVTVVNFGTKEDAAEWETILFSSEMIPVVRMYSTLALDVTHVRLERALEAVNLANYGFILDGVIDLIPSSRRIRIRDAYRGEGRTLNPVELPHVFWAHVSKVALWNTVFQTVLFSTGPVEATLTASVIDTNAKLAADREEAIAKIRSDVLI